LGDFASGGVAPEVDDLISDGDAAGAEEAAFHLARLAGGGKFEEVGIH